MITVLHTTAIFSHAISSDARSGLSVYRSLALQIKNASGSYTYKFEYAIKSLNKSTNMLTITFYWIHLSNLLRYRYRYR